MKYFPISTYPLALALILSLHPGAIRSASAADAGEIESAEVESNKASIAAPRWASEVQTKYNLTDAQMKSFADAGISGPQLAISAELAKASGKTTDEIIKMRTTDKMGWGKIAKTLGVAPSSIGQSVSSLNHDLKDKHSEKHDMSEKKKEKREEKNARREERRKDHREEKAGKSAQPGNGH